MKRIRSKIEEGNLNEKKLEHRTSIRSQNAKQNKNQTKNYVLPNKVICFTKQNTDFFEERLFLLGQTTGIRYCDQNKHT
jgi:hypothetical protein